MAAWAPRRSRARHPDPSPPDSVRLADDDFFNEYLQAITFGSSLSFRLDLTEEIDPSASLPDSFAFYLLDPSQAPLFETTDWTGALFAVDIDGSASGVLYNAAPVDPALEVSWTVSEIPSGVPEPTTLWLLSGGLLGGLAMGRRRVSTRHRG